MGRARPSPSGQGCLRWEGGARGRQPLHGNSDESVSVLTLQQLPLFYLFFTDCGNAFQGTAMLWVSEPSLGKSSSAAGNIFPNDSVLRPERTANLIVVSQILSLKCFSLSFEGQNTMVSPLSSYFSLLANFICISYHPPDPGGRGIGGGGSSTL